MPDNEDNPHIIIATRKHEIIEAREEQLAINLLALRGGKPYIEERLSRFPGERESQWSGRSRHMVSVTATGIRGSSLQNITGRRDRASLVNHCGRIANKLNQYVFRSLPKREGIDETFALDVSLSGQNINEFWSWVSQIITATRWCWICCDAPRVAPARPGSRISKLEKERNGIRVYWSIYFPDQVVDWRHDEAGNLTWLLTETTAYDNTNPFKKPLRIKTRSLWEPGKRTDYVFKANDSEAIDHVDVIASPIQQVPFIPVGDISADPWWFDSVESINRIIMDLESITDQNIFDAVFPLLVVPSSLAKMAQQRPNVNLDEMIDTVLGNRTAVAESAEESGITRFVVPPKTDLNFVREEINSKKQDLFETVGLSLRLETRMVESAESKEWSNLDAESVLIERANILEEAETKLIEKTKQVDASFKDYEPIYSKRFDISDLKEDMEALILGDQILTNERAKKEIAKSTVRALYKRGLIELEDQDLADLLTEIEEEEIEEEVDIELGNARNGNFKESLEDNQAR